MTGADLACIPLLLAVLVVGRLAGFFTGLAARFSGFCGASGRGPSRAVAETWSRRRPGAAAPRGPRQRAALIQ
ncbi:hypothetical protein DNK56_00110 [Streptomyces sp. AC1-42W]|nr:hypothetical protein DNK55_24675 [Streptomyces sp. AC1-42T]PZT75411.1 hypothetical protein DNK56_18065 [Streptomyces sp. AC1-42W]PZT80357.1 hypothetical protein DNK55_12910 [Streptomyces sp. AC1-42T]PZT80709.1 hypothetical protein DNK56_00110 [Streptomyces sp. AC1-42W]